MLLFAPHLSKDISNISNIYPKITAIIVACCCCCCYYFFIPAAHYSFPLVFFAQFAALFPSFFSGFLVVWHVAAAADQTGRQAHSPEKDSRFNQLTRGRRRKDGRNREQRRRWWRKRDEALVHHHHHLFFFNDQQLEEFKSPSSTSSTSSPPGGKKRPRPGLQVTQTGPLKGKGSQCSKDDDDLLEGR